MPPSTRFRPSQAPSPRRVTRRAVATRKPGQPDAQPDAAETAPAAEKGKTGARGAAARKAAVRKAAVRKAAGQKTGAQRTEAEETARSAGSRFTRLSALRARPWSVPVALAVLAVLLGGFALWFATSARHLRGTASADNTALTDNATTSAVNGQVASAVNTLFSYDYTNLDKTQQAAHGLLLGDAVCEYDALFQVVRQQAPQQHLVVTVTATNTGVEALTGNRARVLVFATQSSTSAVTKATSTAGAMFAVDAVRQGGRWRIENIDTFTGDQSGSACK